jgi:hypothetical protein
LPFLLCSVALSQNWQGSFVVGASGGQETVTVDEATGAVHVNGFYVGDCIIVGLDIFWSVGERYYCLQGAYLSDPDDSGQYSEYPPIFNGDWKNVEL